MLAGDEASRGHDRGALDRSVDTQIACSSLSLVITTRCFLHYSGSVRPVSAYGNAAFV